MVKNDHRISFLTLVAVAWVLGLALLFTSILLLAAVTRPIGEIIVYSNYYGEMVIEMLLLIGVVWPVITVGLMLAYRRLY